MSQPCICDDSRYRYVLSQREDRLEFNAAKKRCASNGGTLLAQNVNRDTYTLLNRCCRNQHFYWIGLLSNDKCLNNNRGERYHWIGTKTCHNEPLLRLPVPSSNNCQAVTLSIKTSNQEIPTPQVQDCTTRQHYICQYKKSMTTSSTDSRATSKSPVIIPKTTTNPTLNNRTSTAFVNSDSTRIELLFGILGGCALFLLLLIILYCRYSKNCRLSQLKRLGKKKSKHSIKSARSNTSEMQVQNQVYFK